MFFEEQFILNHHLGSFKSYIYNMRGIHEKLTLLNKHYQVKVSDGGGRNGWVKKIKIKYQTNL